MLINNNEEPHVKFISYTGKYPNLCSGILTLEIYGEIYIFGHDYLKDNYMTDGNNDSFWESGGYCVENRYAFNDEWVIDASLLPE